jgi:hypothetical protein
MRWTEHWVSSVLLLSFVSIRIINDADAFVVTTTTTKPLLRLSSSWSSRQQRKPSYRWHSKVDDATAEQTQVASSPARQTKLDKKWMKQYENLKAFNTENGHCNVPALEGSLGQWVHTQRCVFKQKKMREDRKKLLNEIGFVWSVGSGVVVDDKKWLEQYGNLKEYKNENGHCSVPKGEGSLGGWVERQRQLHNKKTIKNDRKDMLDEIGFVWDAIDEEWQNKYKKLKEFQEIHGHVNLPRDNLHRSNHALSGWVHWQRINHAAVRLDPERKAMLDELGLVWVDPEFERYERQWVAKFHALEDFKRAYGHTRVPLRKSRLGNWVSHQRDLYHKGRLPKARKMKLESIDFVWRLRDERCQTPLDELWMKKYQELQDFQQEHGHANVKINEGSLGRWASTQRQNFRKEDLCEDRKQLLDKIGFVWDIGKESRDELWRAKYEELKVHQMEFGHTNVSHVDNNNLRTWIRRQRIRREAGRLEPERKAMLEEVGI